MKSCFFAILTFIFSLLLYKSNGNVLPLKFELTNAKFVNLPTNKATGKLSSYSFPKATKTLDFYRFGKQGSVLVNSLANSCSATSHQSGLIESQLAYCRITDKHRGLTLCQVDFHKCFINRLLFPFHVFL